MMIRRCLKKLEWLLVLQVILLVTCGKETGNKSTNITAGFPNKPCFISDPRKLPNTLRPDGNVTCLPDGPKAFGQLPDLLFEGVKYSSIDYKQDKENPPEVFAFNQFKISKGDGQDRARYFKRCIRLYESVWMGVRSVDARKNERAIRELETVISFLNLQIRRLTEGVSDVEAALKNALAKCFRCGVKDRYNLVALASESGVDPEEFLKTLDGLKCKSRVECQALLAGRTLTNDSATPLNSSTQLLQQQNHNNLVTINPATNHSPSTTFDILILSLSIVASSAITFSRF